MLLAPDLLDRCGVCGRRLGRHTGGPRVVPVAGERLTVLVCQTCGTRARYFPAEIDARIARRARRVLGADAA